MAKHNKYNRNAPELHYVTQHNLDKLYKPQITDEQLDAIISNGVKMYLGTERAAEFGPFIRQYRDIIYPIMEGCVTAGIIAAIDNHITGD